MAQINTNTTSLEEILNTVNSLPNAGSGGEDVTAETEAYTAKIASLETAVTALESELEGKASGGSSEIATCTVDIKMNGYNIAPHLFYPKKVGNEIIPIEFWNSGYEDFDDGTIGVRLLDCVCNTIIYVYDDNFVLTSASTTGGISHVTADSGAMMAIAFTVTGDGAILLV